MNDLYILYLLLLNTFLVFVVLICFIHFNTSKPTYFRVGPSPDLMLINISINTWNIYASTLVVTTLFRLSNIVLTRKGRMNISNDSSRPLYTIISCISSLLYSISFILLLKIYITQFDYAIISITTGELLFSIIDYSVWKYKTTKSSCNELNTKILDVSTINPVFEPRLEFQK